MSNPPFRILKRPTQTIQCNEENNIDSSIFESSSRPVVPSRTLEEKEAHYASVRKRIMGSDSDDNVTSDDKPADSSDAKLDLKTTEEADRKLAEKEKPPKPVTEKGSPKTSPVAVSTATSKPVVNAVPLMSIPTAALTLPPGSLENDSRLLNFILPPRQNQAPLLGPPQNTTPLLSKTRHSDTVISRGLASAPQMYTPFMPLQNSANLSGALPTQNSRQSLPSLSRIPPPPPPPDATNMQQQQPGFQMFNWPVGYQQFPQQSVPNPLLRPAQQPPPPPAIQAQQQAFLPPMAFDSSVVTANGGVAPRALGQGILQNSNPRFYQPSTR